MPQKGHKDKESMKTFSGSNDLQSLDVSSETAQSSDVAALGAFFFCVLTQKPLEPTSKVFQSCTLNSPMLTSCKNRCIKQIREVWVVPLKSDSEYIGMVIEVFFSFPTHFENAMACFISLLKKKNNIATLLQNYWRSLSRLGPQICRRPQKQTKLW